MPMFSLNKTIAYTKSWKHTLLIAIMLGTFVSLLLILLKPFDTSEAQLPNLTLKLWGYSLCFIIPVLALHYLENYFHGRQGNRWFLLNETLFMVLSLLVIMSCCFVYHWYFISPKEQLYLDEWMGFIKNFGLPFLPILIPIWVYLRSKYGVIEILDITNSMDRYITILGESKSESLSINLSDFIYAHAQQNYVNIFFKDQDGIQQKMLRSTLSNLIKQLPEAWQVHRSYLVNLDYLKSVSGNARKRSMALNVNLEPIPISQKYFNALYERLSNSSQNLQ